MFFYVFKLNLEFTYKCILIENTVLKTWLATRLTYIQIMFVEMHKTVIK